MKRFSKTTLYLLLGAAALTFLYPFYWMILASLTPEAQIGELSLAPQELTWDNYAQMMAKIPIWRALLNSAIVAVLATLGVL
ncbi:hypothetical protein RZS08_01100, partial [Arthrospira platensis SPKY1]|nr:hypothetical protein [Arthrospira platensis SPKY1]